MSIATESFRVEPVQQRIRATLGGKVVLDTTDARLLFEPKRIPVYLFPKAALDPELLIASEKTGTDRIKGPTRHGSIRVGDGEATDAVTAYPEATQSELDGLVAIRWDAMDHWFAEDQEILVHAKNPYHRVDTYPSSRHVEVYADGVKVADTRRALFVYETDMPPRYYIPKLDVRMDLLEKVEKRTGCPYKGFASYYQLNTGTKVYKMRVWEYEAPLLETITITGHLAFYQEKLEVFVEGERA